MGLEDFLYNGKTKSGPFFVFSAGKIGFVKAFPYFFQAVLWNTDTGILYGNENLLILSCRLDIDHRIIVSEFDGIVDQDVH